MSDTGDGPGTPEVVQQVAQSRTPADVGFDAAVPKPPGLGARYRFGDRLTEQGQTKLYQRTADEPLYRPLSIYTRDPGVSRLQGAVAEVNLPYEPLEPGPVGSVLEVDSRDAAGLVHPPADLDSRNVLLSNGYPPSLSRPEFHQQMVYAVAMLTYDHFKVALGRNVEWAFPASNGRKRLRLRPFGAMVENAWYDRDRGEIVFGYFTAKQSTPVAQQGRGRVYTSLSHDIITHEMSHALLDGLRAHFLTPTHEDVLAFHEAFADLVAFFQHFSYEEALKAALRETRGDLAQARGLISIGQEFGRGLGLELGTLRTFAEDDGTSDALRYDNASNEPHERGKVLSRAVYRAFETIYRRRIRRFVKLATGGSGELPPGDISDDLLTFLVDEAAKLAKQFLTICVRAIDYCPPVDILFGDYLRAIITADRDLVPDDTLAYRETLIRSFGEYHVYGEGTESMTEDALVWRGPEMQLPVDDGLSVSALRLTNDMTEPADPRQLVELAGALGRLVSDPIYAREFGLVSPLGAGFDRASMNLPCIQSIRIARRIGPKHQVTLDLVAEVTQRIDVQRDGVRFPFHGGSTIILDAEGRIRFVIRKRVDNEKRQNEQKQYIDSAEGTKFWEKTGNVVKLRPRGCMAAAW